MSGRAAAPTTADNIPVYLVRVYNNNDDLDLDLDLDDLLVDDLDSHIPHTSTSIYSTSLIHSTGTFHQHTQQHIKTY